VAEDGRDAELDQLGRRERVAGASVSAIAAFRRGESAESAQPSSIIATSSSESPSRLATAKRTFRQ
jgi:hypothetical protein